MIKSGDYQYILLTDGTAELTNYTAYAEFLTVPAQIDGHAVTSIGSEAFINSEFLSSIILPDCLTTIGIDAFCGCSFLTSITLPDSLLSIGGNPFAHCDKLTQIQVSPDHSTLVTINGVLFNKAEKELICYPYAFMQESYTVPCGITSIGNNAFYECSSLTSITLPDNLTTIEAWAFSGCESLESITLPGSPTCIRNWAFSGCKSLASIALPNSLTTIGNGAFAGCESLTNITLPSSLTTIGNWAFESCSVSLSFTVVRGSWAENWCKENGKNYTYSNSID